MFIVKVYQYIYDLVFFGSIGVPLDRHLKEVGPGKDFSTVQPVIHGAFVSFGSWRDGVKQQLRANLKDD